MMDRGRAWKIGIIILHLVIGWRIVAFAHRPHDVVDRVELSDFVKAGGMFRIESVPGGKYQGRDILSGVTKICQESNTRFIR